LLEVAATSSLKELSRNIPTEVRSTFMRAPERIDRDAGRESMWTHELEDMQI
jgi:hypothetical protein